MKIQAGILEQIFLEVMFFLYKCVHEKTKERDFPFDFYQQCALPLTSEGVGVGI